MHDIRAIRADPEAFDAAMARRGLPRVSEALLAVDADRRAALAAMQDRQARRNALAKQIGAGRRTGADTAVPEAEATALRDEMAALEARAAELDAAIPAQLAVLPNALDPDVPDGADETANVVLHQHGEPRDFAFPPQEHFQLGEALGGMDFERAARMSGSRFTLLRGPVARMERALGQFMLDLHTREHGYTEMAVPLLVNDAAAYGTDKLPKFAEDLFRTTDGRWLIPTAEVPLTSLVMDEIVPEDRLPIRVAALSECFRSEAGSAGRDTRGMLRQHQFRKVELVSITHPDHSAEEHERMTACAEAVLRALDLPFRRVLLCSGDTGFGAAKTYDLEVWLPGQGAWREISSCSNTRAFQARRMNARLRGGDGKVAGPVHTLNGSGVALGRALIAVMETYQQADGSVAVPAVLGPYMGGVERISAAPSFSGRGLG
ncbi:MAG: serine--tRNA ligase [Janthinobacterium lividum]